jgi:hypothetical protein
VLVVATGGLERPLVAACHGAGIAIAINSIKAQGLVLDWAIGGNSHGTSLP